MKTSAIVGAVIVIIVILAIGVYYATTASRKSAKTTSSTPYTSVQSTAYTTVPASTSLKVNSTTVSTTISNTSSKNSTSNTTTVSGAPLIRYYAVNVSTNSLVGNYLTNTTGYTLYINTKDTPNGGTSICYGTCATIWPAFYANVSSGNLPSGLNASSFNTITRTDGTKQLTYKGYPLYYYSDDTKKGTVNGEGVEGIWFAATTPNLTTST